MSLAAAGAPAQAAKVLVPLTIKDIALHATAVALIIIGTFLSVKILRKIIDRKSKFVGSQWTPLRFFSHFLYGMIYFFGFILCIYMIPPLRSLSLSIFASSGVLAIVIGFAAQNAFANLVSGLFIAIFKPFTLGDKIKFIGRDISGTVEDITLRHTIIRTFENKRIIVPNSVVSVDVIENANIIEEKVCRFLEIGISYDSNIDLAMGIIQDEVKNHPSFYDNRTDEEKQQNVDPVKVKVVRLADFSIQLRAWVWGRDNPTSFDMVCDLNKSIKERFDREGIEIPFPYRTIVYKKQPASLPDEDLETGGVTV